MGTPREELSFVFKTEADSIFIYYLTGTLALVFMITLLITRSLQRKQPMVTELIHDSNTSEVLLTHLVTIQTSIWPGSGCPSGVKVYMQLIGPNRPSQYFLLQSAGSTKPLLQRGFTDVFMVKLPMSVLPITSVNFIMSGLQGPLKWKIRRVEVHQPCSDKSWSVPACIVVTERCETDTYHSIKIGSAGRSCLEKLLVYHQWLAQFGNAVRYGAFTTVTHVICVFATLTYILDLTLVTYILLPGGQFEGEFELNYISLLIGTISPALGYCCMLLLVEVILRNVKSKSKKPGNAYYTLKDENKNMAIKYEPKELYKTKEMLLINDNMFTFPLVWDDKFKTKTVLLKKLLSEVDLISRLQYFRSDAVFEDNYVSAYDLSSHLTIHIPQYSGVALNHLLGAKTSTAHMKGSSMLDVIHKDASFHSIRSVLSSKSIKAKESESSDIIIDLFEDDLGLIRLSDYSLTRANPSVISSVCSVDGTLFWSQYKQFRQQKHNKSEPELTEENDENENSRKLDDADKDPFKQEVESDKHDKIKHQSDKMKGDGNKGKKSAAKAGGSEDTDVIIDFTDVDQEFEIKLEMMETTEKQPESVNKGKNEDELQKQGSQFSMQNLSMSGMPFDKEAILKSRSRKLVADICKFYRKIRVQVIEGEIIHVIPEILEWFDNVIECIMIACTEKSDLNMQEHIALKGDAVATPWTLHTSYFQYISGEPRMMNLLIYMSGEVILMTVHKVYRALNSGNMDLPDIVVLSHCIMLSVQETAYTLLYTIENCTFETEQLNIMSELDIHKYMMYICTEFLKHCFQLIVHANELTWAYFEIYLLQKLRNHLKGLMFQELMTFVEDNLQYETVETVVLQKLCKSAIEEAKCEVWEEYSDERNIFIDLTVKQEVLDKISSLRTQIRQREKAFNEKYQLLAKKRKSRLQKLAEKRSKKYQEEQRKKEKVKDLLSKWKLWQQETGSSAIPSYKELIQHSMQLDKMNCNLKTVQTCLKKKWSRQGLKREVDGVTCLVQSLVFSHIDMENVVLQFKNYLQLKRVEQCIKEFLHMMLEDLSGCIVSEAVRDYNLSGCPDDLQLKLAVDDICIRADTMKDLLLQELDSITEYALAIEDHKLLMDKSLIETTTSLIMKKSSKMLQWAPTVSEILNNQHKKSKKSSSEHSYHRKDVQIHESDSWEIDVEVQEEIEFTVDVTDHEPDVKGVKYKDNDLEDKEDQMPAADVNEEDNGVDDEAVVAVDSEIVSPIDCIATDMTLDDLKTEMKFMKLYLREYQEKENLRSLCMLTSHIEKQKQSRSRITNTILNNIIDSYYIIEEGDDSHTFTKAGLYQIEYDITGESCKPLPTYLKSLIVGLLFLGILFSFIMVTLVGGQFSTIQNQEFVCYYLIALVEFALLFEPIRALMVAWICDK